jgi:hypothetical protein
MYDLEIKAETFWKYEKSDKESWDSHHENEQTLKKTFSTLSKMIETTRKARNNYEKTLRRINVLWRSNEEKFARDQLVQLLKNMRRCALRDLSLNNFRRVVNLTISLTVESGFEQKFKPDPRVDVLSDWTDQRFQSDSRIDVRRILSSLFDANRMR